MKRHYLLFVLALFAAQGMGKVDVEKAQNLNITCHKGNKVVFLVKGLKPKKNSDEVAEVQHWTRKQQAITSFVERPSDSDKYVPEMQETDVYVGLFNSNYHIVSRHYQDTGENMGINHKWLIRSTINPKESTVSFSSTVKAAIDSPKPSHLALPKGYKCDRLDISNVSAKVH